MLLESKTELLVPLLYGLFVINVNNSIMPWALLAFEAVALDRTKSKFLFLVCLFDRISLIPL